MIYALFKGGKIGYKYIGVSVREEIWVKVFMFIIMGI